MTYVDELTAAMTWLGVQPDTMFIGQQTRYPGNALFQTLSGVPAEKRVELPVIEDAQMGMSIGLAMTGKTVISIYPRMDFLMCAMNQLVNHLDKNLYPLPGRVIIRTCVGSTKPLHPGVQHCGNYTVGLVQMLKNTGVKLLNEPREIMWTYQHIVRDCWNDRYNSSGLTPHNWIVVEYGDLYAA